MAHKASYVPIIQTSKGLTSPFCLRRGDEESAGRFLLYGMPLTGTAYATHKFACANFPFGQTASCKVKGMRREPAAHCFPNPSFDCGPVFWLSVSCDGNYLSLTLVLMFLPYGVVSCVKIQT